MNRNMKICIVGHKGMLGHALENVLRDQGYKNIVGCDLPEVDLCNQLQAINFFEKEKPEYVFFLAAVAAGINYKKEHPATMMLKNMQIITNVMDGVYKAGCKRMLNVCSALVYPSGTEIPFREDATTHVNFTEVDSPYAVAKAAGMQLAKFYNKEFGMEYTTAVPCNFFGEYAPYDGDRAGVVSALISRMHEAKKKELDKVVVWGTGNACRDLLNSKDVASACVFLMENTWKYDIVNIGRGEEYTIREVAETIKKVVGYEGILEFDATKPEGKPHMMMEISRLTSMGWKPSMNLEESIQNAYQWYVKNIVQENRI